MLVKCAVCYYVLVGCVSLMFLKVRHLRRLPPQWYRPEDINNRLAASPAGALCAVLVAKEPPNAGNTQEQL